MSSAELELDVSVPRSSDDKDSATYWYGNTRTRDIIYICLFYDPHIAAKLPSDLFLQHRNHIKSSGN